MGLIDTIARIFSGRGAQQAETTADRAAPAGPDGAHAFAMRFTAETERAATVRACREMYKGDPRAKGVIQGVARDAVKGGFRVSVPGDARAEEAANNLVKRLKLFSRIDDWVRLTLRDGDSFLEVGITGAREIVDVTRKPTLSMHRNSNDADRFDDPALAYWYAAESWIGQAPPRDALWFADWQIVHARWDHDEGSRYGAPLFASATGAFKRVKEGEVDIAVRRKTRAGMRYLHSLEGANETDLLAYQEKNKEALSNPFSAIADFFVNKKATIQTVQGDANLSQIDDVLHHIRTWWTASPMPMSLLGYGQDLNRDVLQEQKDQYDQAIEQITQWVEDQLVVPLLERQWLLAGILPEGLEYEIEWASKRPLKATDIRDVADAALRLGALGISPEVVQSVIGRFLPGLGLELAGAESESERIADTADKLRGQL